MTFAPYAVLENKQTHSKEKEIQQNEDVLLVPQRLTKSAYDILSKYGVNSKPWHFQGRYGSRTHRINKTTMGLPITSKEILKQQAI